MKISGVLIFVAIVSLNLCCVFANPVTTNQEQNMESHLNESLKAEPVSPSAIGISSLIEGSFAAFGAILRPVVSSITPLANAVTPIIQRAVHEIVVNISHYVGNSTLLAINQTMANISEATAATRLFDIDESPQTQDDGDVSGTLDEFMNTERVLTEGTESIDDNENEIEQKSELESHAKVFTVSDH